MSKDRVYLVLSHQNSLKKGSKSEWEVTETIEFVNCLKKKHNSMATVIGDYLERKIIKGSASGITDYERFEEYVRSKYGPQMKILDKSYRPEDLSIVDGDTTPIIADQDGILHADAI